MRKSFLLFILFCAVRLSAQTVGGGFVLGFPEEEFGEKVKNTGLGFQIQGTLYTPTKEKPFTIGLDASYMIYGSESSSRPLSETIPDVWVNVNRTNNIANFHLLFQLSPFAGDVRPYAEALFGGAYMFTTTKVESENSGADVFESTNLDAFTWSYGGGGGMLIKLKSNLGSVKTLFLDIKARYSYGSEAEYLKEGSVRIVNGRALYDVQKSKTDLLTIQFGVVAYF
jgi:hypothetical protein